jgi:hypothetical protein
MWYHRVSQTRLSIAVNYWYEQRFDNRYSFFQMANGLKEIFNNSEKISLLKK